jgi:hypothetical protein
MAKRVFDERPDNARYVFVIAENNDFFPNE